MDENVAELEIDNYSSK